MSTLETYLGWGPDPGNLLPSPDTPPTYPPYLATSDHQPTLGLQCLPMLLPRASRDIQPDGHHPPPALWERTGRPPQSVRHTYLFFHTYTKAQQATPPPTLFPHLGPPPTWHHPPPCLVWHLPCLKANHFPSRAPCPPIHPAVADQLWQERQHLPLDRQHLPRLGREQTGFAGFGILNRRGGKILAVPLHPPAIVCVSHSAFHPPPSPRCLHSASFPHLPPTKAPSITSLTPSPKRQRRGRADPTICTSQATGPRDLESWPNMSNG